MANSRQFDGAPAGRADQSHRRRPIAEPAEPVAEPAAVVYRSPVGVEWSLAEALAASPAEPPVVRQRRVRWIDFSSGG